MRSIGTLPSAKRNCNAQWMDPIPLMTLLSRRQQHRWLRSFPGSVHDEQSESLYDEAQEDHSQQAIAASDEPWKTLLEMPARAAWRVTSSIPVPDRLQLALTNVLNEGGRNRKQLRRTHESVLEQHRLLSESRERERYSLIYGTKQGRHKSWSNTQQVDSSEMVQSVMYGPDEALSAFYFRLLPHYVVTQRVLTEARSLLGHTFEPTRILDFGVGIGSSSAAAINVFGASTQWVHGVDPSQTMRDGAKYFLEEFLHQKQSQNDGKATANTTTASSAPALGPPRLTFSSHISAESVPGTFCLALLCYTATELPHISATLAAAAVCWEKIRPGGLFVMIEPGTPDGFSSVRSVRSMLLDCFSESDSASLESCHIIAPCTHNGRCPMERFINKDMNKRRHVEHDVTDEALAEPTTDDGDNHDDDDADDDNAEDGIRKGYCSFVQGMPGGTGGGKGEKFTYIVAEKRLKGGKLTPENGFTSINIPDLLQRTLVSTQATQDEGQPPNQALLTEALNLESLYLDSNDDDLGLEFLSGDVNRQSFGRIIRAPKKKKGHVLIDCCAAPGKIVRSKISKSMSKSIPGIYAASRKSRWGGLWPQAPDLEVK